MSNQDNRGWDNDDSVAIPDDHPVPILWRILVAPIRAKKQTASGIVIAQEARQAQEHLNYVGKIVAWGDMAFQDKRFQGDSNLPKVGDFVVYGRYAGQPMIHKGVKFLIINDDEILAVVKDPESLTIHV